jgi:hypothetical protein
MFNNLIPPPPLNRMGFPKCKKDESTEPQPHFWTRLSIGLFFLAVKKEDIFYKYLFNTALSAATVSEDAGIEPKDCLRLRH